jgi:hypothetical protein
MPKPTQPPVSQYNILDPFSDNDYDNLKQLVYPFVGTPPVSGSDPHVGDLYDLTQEIELNSCLLDDSFELTYVNSTRVTVGTGRCIIGGVCIDIKESKSLTITSSDSYFSSATVITKAGTLYVLVYYDYDYSASVSERLAYVGLMKKTEYSALSSSEQDKYCFIGAIKVDSQVEIITPVYYVDPDDSTQVRPYPSGWADGGWLDIPEDFIV